MALVLYEVQQPIAVITLNRPERHNSLVPALLHELLAALDAARRDGVRAVILEANGRSFSTGGDVRAFYEHKTDLADYSRKIVRLLNRVILALADLPMPVIAAVAGIVTGGSLGLLLASDIVLLAPEAGITPWYSVVGFSPDGGWTAWLPEVIGAKRAARVLLTNATISPGEAVRWGLAAEIVPSALLQGAARRTAQDLARMQPGSLMEMRQLLRPDCTMLAQRLEAEAEAFVRQVTSAEALAGMEAFLKR